MLELRLALRALRRTPVVSVAAILSLAIGIGANAAVFNVASSLLVRRLPVAEPERLATISSDFALGHGFTAGLGWNFPMWLRLQDRAGAVEGVASWTATQLELGRGGERQPVRGLFASGDFFGMLGVGPRAGRLFTVADDVRGGGPDGPVAVISDRFWQRHFARASTAIGSTLAIENVTVTVIGVTPPDFAGVEVGQPFDIALPLGVEPLLRGRRSVVDREESFLLIVMLRLKSGQTLENATAALRSIHTEVLGGARVPKFFEEPLVLVSAATGADTSRLRWEYQRPLLTIFAAVALVLLVACVNIGHVLLARAAARRDEVSLKLALGAPRLTLALQPLTESLVLAFVGALVGLALAGWGSGALAAYLFASVGGAFPNLAFDWRVLLFTAAVAVSTALVFGAAPAVGAARTPPLIGLRQMGRQSSADRRRPASTLLVITQIGASLTLVVVTGLLLGTFARLAHGPLGFRSDGLLVVNVDTSRARVDLAARVAFYDRLVESVSSVPGIASGAASIGTPLSEARESPMWGQPEFVFKNAVTPGWFGTYGTSIRSGRDFNEGDTAASQPVTVVNEAYTRRFLSNRTALGATVEDRTIVGVVADTVIGSVRVGMRPAMYVPLAQSGDLRPPDHTRVSVTVRTVGPPADFVPGIGAAFGRVDPSVTFSARTMGDYVSASIAQERLLATLSGAFGILALLLASVGLYGVLSHSVSRRRTEIGIRMALGASPGDIMRSVLGRASLLLLAGVVAGGIASLWLSRYVGTLLYGVDPWDPATFMGSVAVLAAVGLTAAWFPARHASRVDPARAVRDH